MPRQRTLKLVPLAEIQPAKSNVKDHDLPLTSASIDRFGFIEIPVVDGRTGRLVAGHGRVDALKRAHQANEPPPEGVSVDRKTKGWLVPVLTGWASVDDDEAAAAAIALNRVGEKGGWVEADLAAELDRLSSTDAGLTGLGFDTSDLDDLLASLQEGPLMFDSAGSELATGGANTRTSYNEQLDGYAVKGVRSIVLDFNLAEYEAVAALAAAARQRRGLDSTAALFLTLLEEDAEHE